jgi:hypothetical protein
MATKNQIKASIKKHRAIQADLRAEREADRIMKRAYASYLVDNGWKIHYRREDNITTAMKWNRITGEVKIHFTVRSPKDQFSRPDARRVLVEHIEEGTHEISFRYLPISPGKSDDQMLNLMLERDARDMDKKALDFRMSMLIGERMLTNPREFPAKTVAQYKKMMQSQLSNLLGQLSPKTGAPNADLIKGISDLLS